MNKIFNTGLVIGKFQPMHKGHKDLIQSALSLCEQVYIVVEKQTESFDFPIIKYGNLYSFDEDPIVYQIWEWMGKEKNNPDYKDIMNRIFIYETSMMKPPFTNEDRYHYIESAFCITSSKPFNIKNIDLVVFGDDEQDFFKAYFPNIAKLCIPRSHRVISSQFLRYICLNNDFELFSTLVGNPDCKRLFDELHLSLMKFDGAKAYVENVKDDFDSESEDSAFHKEIFYVLRKYTGESYKDCKNALIATNWRINDAMIYIEQNKTN